MTTFAIPRLLAVLVLAATVPGQAVQFVEGDLGRLRCTYERVAESQNLVLARVKVKNSTRSWVDPMAFTLDGVVPRGADPVHHEVWRAPHPHVRRYGRAVRPGGTETYFVQFAAWKGPDRYKAAVSRAVFHDGLGIARPDVRVGALEHDHFEDAAGRFPLTRFTVRHDHPVALDLMFVATMTRPMDGKVLVHVHVLPGAETKTELRIVSSSPFELGGGVIGAHVTRLELVDWSAEAPGNVEAGTALAQAALRGWLRWPQDHPPLEGRFAFEFQNPMLTPRTGKAEGRFRIAGGKVSILEASGDERSRVSAGTALSAAFGELFHATAGELGTRTVRLTEPEWVRIEGPSILKTTGGDGRGRFRVENGRITGTLVNELLEEWRTEPMADGWVVVGRSRGGVAPRREDRTWTRVAGLLVPDSFHVEQSFANGDRLGEHLTVSGMKPAAAPVPLGPPTGPAVEELRAAWEVPYRYPEGPVTLTGRFSIENTNNRMDWRGRRKVSGAITLHGFAGWRRMGGRYERAEITLDEDPGGDIGAGIRSLIRGRLGMWAARDLAGRRSFDEAFAGAELTGPDKGVVAVKGGDGRIAAVHIDGGAVVQIDGAGGATWRWKLGKASVPFRVEYGEGAVIEARWRQVGDWWLPAQVTFRETLGADFGVEVLKWSQLRIE